MAPWAATVHEKAKGALGLGFRGSRFNEKIHSDNPERGTVNV
jgi:hypothetical protein